MAKKSNTKTNPHDTHGHDHHDHDHDHNHSHHHHDDQSSVLAPNTTFTIKLPWKEVDAAYQTILKHQATRVKAPGFRQGKVPTKIAADIIGQNKLIEATLDQLLPAAYSAALKKGDHKPLTNPDIRPTKIELGSDWELEVQIAERPDVKLGAYQDLVKKAKKTGEKDVKEAEQKLAEQAKKTAKDPAVQSDKNAASTPMTDEQKKEMVLKQIFKSLITEIKPRIPELLIREETRRELENLVRNLDQLKLTLDEYLQRRQMSFDQLSGEIAATLLGQIQLEFILDQVATTAKITVSDDEVKAVANRIEDEKQRQAQLADERYLSYVKASLQRQKIVDHLLSL
jgi:FKBP-type peptidyl-prolyl cis-trans isomerase (trigger factor)